MDLISAFKKKIIFGRREKDLVLENDFFRQIWNQNNLPYVLYTEKQLKCLHRNFGHRSASALYRLLKRADYIDTNENTLRKYASAPRRFKLTMGSDDLKFNHVVAVDMIFISKRPILHVVDEATHFMAARFLRNHSSTEVWNALLRCWSRIYLGPPDYLRVDQGSNLPPRNSSTVLQQMV